MQDSSLEKQMQQLMSGLEFEPDAAVWENVEREINKEKKKRIAAWWWLTGVLLLGLSGGIVWYSMNDTSSARPVAAAAAVDSLTKPAPKETAALTADKPQQQQAHGRMTSADEKQAAGSGLVEKPSVAITGNNTTQGIAGSQQVVIAKTEVIQSGKLLQSAGSLQHSSALQNGGSLQNSNASQLNNSPQSSGILKNNNPLQRGNSSPNNSLVQNNSLLQNSISFQSNIPVQSSLLADTAVSETTTVLPFIDAGLITSKETDAVNVQPVVSAYYNPFTPAVIAPLKKRVWRIFPVAGVGIAANIGGVNTSNGFSNSASGIYYSLVAAPDKNSVADNISSNPNTGTGGGSTPIYYYTNQRLTHPKASFRFGFELEKYIAPRWRLLTGAQYQYLSYNSLIKSKVTGNFSSSLNATSNTTFLYKLNYVAVPVQLQYRISVPFAVTAGILNSFSLTGRQNDERIKEAMRTYIPSGSLMFDIILYNRKQQVWKISPYVQYGFTSSFKGTLEDKRMLQTGIQAIFQINK